MPLNDIDYNKISIFPSRRSRIFFDYLSKYNTPGEYCNIYKHPNVQVHDIIFHNTYENTKSFYGVLLTNDDLNIVNILRVPFLMRQKSDKIKLWKSIINYINENNIIDLEIVKEYYMGTKILDETDYFLYLAPYSKPSDILALISNGAGILEDYSDSFINPELLMIVPCGGHIKGKMYFNDIDKHISKCNSILNTVELNSEIKLVTEFKNIENQIDKLNDIFNDYIESIYIDI